MESVKIDWHWLDDFLVLFYRAILPFAIMAILCTGHFWGLPDSIRELLIGILGLCINLKIKKGD